MAVYAGQYGPSSIEYPDGGHAILVPILVTTLGGIPIPLYADRHRVDTLDNPVFTDELGNLTFYAEPGKYFMSFSNKQLQISVPEDPTEPDTELSPEDREAIVDDAVGEALVELEPPVNLTLLFNNVISQGA